MFYPIKFKPVYKEYIWGGRNLEKFKGNLPKGNIAESWEISTHKDGMSIVMNGELEGKTLHEIVQQYGHEFVGNELPKSAIDKFPLLIKLIDANDKLSVQVHPHDEYALVNEKENGKNEMWYIVEAKPGAQIIYDVKPNITKEDFEKAVKEGQIAKCLKHVKVSKGDFINIPAGVIHAIGDGIIIAEIQQSSNTTYRLYDYDRVDVEGKKRPLHIEKALDVINFDSHKRKENIEGIKIDLTENSYKIIKSANENFVVEIYEIDGNVCENTYKGKFHIYVLVDGAGKIKYRNDSIYIRAGESVLIPAGLESYELEGTFRALKTYVPDIQKDIVEPLLERGYTEKEIYSNINITQ